MEDASLDIEKRLAQLPEDIRQAVLSVEWEAKVQQLGAKEGLHIDQVGALGDTTLMAMLGMFEMPELPTRITQALGVPPEKAATLAQALTNDVFMPIRASMRSMGEKKPQPQAPLPAPAAAPIPASVPTPAATPKPDFSKADGLLSANVVATAPSAPAPAPKPVAAAPAPAAPQAPKAPAAPAAPSVPAAPAAPVATTPTTPEPPKPGTYTNDPYREPPV